MNKEEKKNYLMEQGFISTPKLYDNLTNAQLDELCANAKALEEKAFQAHAMSADEMMKIRNQELVIAIRKKDQEVRAMKDTINNILYPLQKLIK